MPESKAGKYIIQAMHTVVLSTKLKYVKYRGNLFGFGHMKQKKLILSMKKNSVQFLYLNFLS
jgi:hypothetical protein